MPAHEFYGNIEALPGNEKRYHSDLLSIPDEFVLYHERHEAKHQQAYDLLGEIDDAVIDAFETIDNNEPDDVGRKEVIVPYEDLDRAASTTRRSISTGLRRVTCQLGPAGAVSYLRKTYQLNRQPKDKQEDGSAPALDSDEDEVHSEGSSRPVEAETVRAPSENGVPISERKQREALEKIGAYVRAAKKEGSIHNDKMSKLLQLFKRFEREADKGGAEGKWKCLLIGKSSTCRP